MEKYNTSDVFQCKFTKANFSRNILRKIIVCNTAWASAPLFII
jgi:hypothetical protein